MERNAEDVTHRILYVDHADLMGGAEGSLLRLMAGLDRTRYEPVLACTPGTPLAEAARRAGIALRPAPMGQLRRRGDPVQVARAWYLGVRELARAAREEGARIVHSNVMRASLYAAPAARLAGLPLVWHVRDIHRERLYLHLMSRLADRIVVISDAVAAPLPAPARRKTRRIPDGLDLERFQHKEGLRGAFRAELGVGADELLVGHVSWLSPWKGPHLFLQMAQRVTARVPNSRFVIVGEAAHPSHAAYVAGLRRQAGETLGERCIFTGARADLPRVLAGLDLLAHTARAEPLGLAVVEAMATGLPVVAFADGGVPEIVVDGETGVLVPPGDVGQMAEAVVGLLIRAERRAALGEAGRRRAWALFSAEAMVRRTEAVYDELLGAAGGRDG